MDESMVSTPESSAPAVEPQGEVKEQEVKQDLTQEELEEIAIGSNKAKLPKHIAKAVKDLEKGFHSKAQEAARLRKEQEEWSKLDEVEFMKKKGKDPIAWAEEMIARKIEELSMSPEQKRAMENERKLAEYEERDRKAKEEMEQQEYTRREQEEMTRLDSEIAEAFKSSGLPKHPYYVQRMAAEMLGASKRGEDLSAAEAAAKVKAKTRGEMREAISQLEPESIEEFLGPEVLKRIREFEVKRVTAKSAPTIDSGKRPEGKTPQAQSKESSKPMNEREYRQWLESLKG
jgi:hypothetical protein